MEYLYEYVHLRGDLSCDDSGVHGDIKETGAISANLFRLARIFAISPYFSPIFAGQLEQKPYNDANFRVFETEVEDIKEVVFEIKEAMAAALSELALLGLDRTQVTLGNQPSLSDECKKLIDEKKYIAKNFRSGIAKNFSALIGLEEEEENGRRYRNLSLVTEEDLNAIIAMEGMVAHSRNSDMKEYLAFTTRLDTLVYSTKIDESNNPMDPEQIGDAFKEAVRPVGLNPDALLQCYRNFNSSVFHELETVLEKANAILIGRGILPDLDITARSKTVQKSKRSRRREVADPAERAFNDGVQTSSESAVQAPQVFSMMQSLMQKLNASPMASPQIQGPAGAEAAVGVPQGVFPQQGEFPGTGKIPVVGYDYGAGTEAGSFALQPGMMVGNQKVEVVETAQLTSVLSKLQSNLDAMAVNNPGTGAAEPVDLNASIGEILDEQGGEDTLNALDNVSADIINLITMIYEAIWQDQTVQIPIKELLGRTQITALKIALDDPSFFDDDNHPGRQFINEIATAGISWTDYEKLENDPTYKKMLELVEALNSNYDGDIDYVMSLVVGFQSFKHKLAQSNRKAEERLKDATAREQRVEEVKEYTLEKIRERILENDIDPFMVELLEVHFHKFLVKVVLKEGPGGVSWKPIMNTIDVLLWSVQPDKDVRDKARFEKLRTRLLQNLQKALLTAGLEKAEVNTQIKGLMEIQKRCFLDAIRKSKQLLAEKEQAKKEKLAKEREEAEKLEQQRKEQKEREAQEKAEREAAERAANPEPTHTESGEINIFSHPEPEEEPVVEEDKFDTEDEVDILEGAEPVELEVEEAPTKPAAPEKPVAKDPEPEPEMDEEMDILALLEAAAKHGDLAEDDEHLAQVNKLPLGVWMEFQGDGEQSIRCTLAAKISTIDKYVFVNSDGVKAVEKSRMGLAKELKAGSVKIISEAPLVDRAMESIIGKLRDADK